MQQSKQLAVMFLLGALLVGGALGFTADRLIARDRICLRRGDPRAMRTVFDAELGLTASQRAQVDTILDAKHRRVEALLGPVKPQLDAINDSTRARIARVLDPQQRARFETLRRAKRPASQWPR